MKNKLLVFMLAFVAVALVGIDQLSAQGINQTSVQYSPNPIVLNSEQGSVIQDAIRYKIHLTGRADYDDWGLQVRVNSNIMNAEGDILDPSRIKIRLMRVDGGPSLNKLGVRRKDIPLSYTYKDIIKEAEEDLKRDDDYDKYWIFVFDIIIAGGDNLKDVKNGLYDFNLTFSLNRENGRPIDETTGLGGAIKVDLPTNEILFGFEVFADASLNFNVPEDYTRKVESSEESWLKVTSKDKGYTVNVQTSDSYFEGESDISVGVVSMQVEDKIGSRTGPEIALKNSGQTVFNGNATGSEPRKLDVRYFISPDNAKGLAIYKPGNYVTRLTYTLLPQ